MAMLIVVDDPKDWPLEIPEVERVQAKAYLTESRYTAMRGAKVFNLCRSYRYQSIGYYVSLLAAARGHKPLPTVTAVQDLKSQTIIRFVSEDLDHLIQKSLTPIQSHEFVLSIYFGRNLAKRYDALSSLLFKQFQAPFLRCVFTYSVKAGKWHLQNVNPMAMSEIAEEHHDFVAEAAKLYFQGRLRWGGRKSKGRFDLAVLVSAKEEEPPSNARALERFVKAGEAEGFNVEMIGREDLGRIGTFDALFIRETTNVNHHTYRFARKAAAEGLVVVDDPESILKCTNKVFLAELLERNKVAAPKTLIVHRGNKDSIEREMGLPCILKQPDSSFSRGVVKVETTQQLHEAVTRMLEKSELIIAQEFLPTPFDWRVGVFDRQPLYACRYYMAKKHWQILKRNSQGLKCDEGRFDTLPVDHIPTPVLRAAVKASNLIGDGLYGVDLKQVGDKVFVIEVNDNPNIDAGIEDRCLKDELYRRIMRVMVRRVEQRKGG